MRATAEREVLRAELHDFVTTEVLPLALECDRQQRFPEELWDRLGEEAILGATISEAYGGAGVDRRTQVVIAEELAYGMLALATAYGVHAMAAACIERFADDSIKEAYIPEMVTGRPVGAFALSEPHAGSNPREMTTLAQHRKDQYEITGTKQWITNGRRAGLFIVFARVDPEDPSSITQFLVPAETDGVTITREEDKLGLRASDTCQVSFDQAVIPETYRLTEVGDGLRSAFEILNGGRISIAAQSNGLARAALDRTREAVSEHCKHAPRQETQACRHTLASLATKLAASRLLTEEAARRDDHDEPVAKFASMAKLFASEMAVDVTNEAVVLHGDAGYLADTEIERLYRDAKVTTIYEGTSEIQKTIIARHLLKD